MKKIIPLILLLGMSVSKAFSQGENLNRLVQFYLNADKECYTALIQKSVDDMTAWIRENRDKKWVVDYFSFELDDFLLLPPDVSLKDERKMFFLSTYIDWFKFKENPSLNFDDCLEIDSTRTFMVACLDNEGHVKGFTDLGEVGTYAETSKQKIRGHHCIWPNMDVIRFLGRNSLLTAYKKHPEFKEAKAVLFIQNEMPMMTSSFLGFVVGGELIIWDFFHERIVDKPDYLNRNSYHELRKGKTWDEYLLEMDAFYKKKMVYTSVRDSVFSGGYIFDLPASKKHVYGVTQPEKLRICPPNGYLKEETNVMDEVIVLNSLFEEERGEFDFNNKTVGFVTISGEFGRRAYFDMLKEHKSNANAPYDKGTLYVFTDEQKQESGGYDAAVVYWSKFQLSATKVISLLRDKQTGNHE